MCYAPHHRHYVAELPPKGKPQSGRAFLPKKMKFTEFFFRQGEGLERPLQSAEADSFPDGEAENKACKDLYRLLTQTLSPKGKPRTRVEYKAFQEKESSPG